MMDSHRLKASSMGIFRRLLSAISRLSKPRRRCGAFGVHGQTNVSSKSKSIKQSSAEVDAVNNRKKTEKKNSRVAAQIKKSAIMFFSLLSSSKLRQDEAAPVDEEVSYIPPEIFVTCHGDCDTCMAEAMTLESRRLSALIESIDLPEKPVPMKKVESSSEAESLKIMLDGERSEFTDCISLYEEPATICYSSEKPEYASKGSSEFYQNLPALALTLVAFLAFACFVISA